MKKLDIIKTEFIVPINEEVDTDINVGVVKYMFIDKITKHSSILKRVRKS